MADSDKQSGDAAAVQARIDTIHALQGTDPEGYNAAQPELAALYDKLPNDDAATGESGDAGDDGEHFEVELSTAPNEQEVNEIFAAVSLADKAGAEGLRQEWGADTAKNIAFARTAAEQVFTQSDREFIEDIVVDGVPLVHFPSIMRMAAAVGRRVARVAGNPSSISKEANMATTPGDADKVQDRIDEIMEMVGTPAYTSKKIQRELNALYEKQGDGPIVGREMRKV